MHFKFYVQPNTIPLLLVQPRGIKSLYNHAVKHPQISQFPNGSHDVTSILTVSILDVTGLFISFSPSFPFVPSVLFLFCTLPLWLTRAGSHHYLPFLLSLVDLEKLPLQYIITEADALLLHTLTLSFIIKAKIDFPSIFGIKWSSFTIKGQKASGSLPNQD